MEEDIFEVMKKLRYKIDGRVVSYNEMMEKIMDNFGDEYDYYVATTTKCLCFFIHSTAKNQILFYSEYFENENVYYTTNITSYIRNYRRCSNINKL